MGQLSADSGYFEAPLSNGELLRAALQDTFERWYVSERINPGVLTVLSAEHPKRIAIMDNEQRIEAWNAQWTMVAGRAVCTCCLES